MLRLILCLLIVLSGVMIGLYCSQRLSKRKTTLSEFSSMLGRAKLLISYSADELCRIFSDNFAGYVFKSDEAFDVQWAELISRYRSVLSDDDISVLTGFAEGIGASDAESQIQHIELYIRLLGEQISSAQRDIDEKSKLYRVLPVSAALILSILLI